MKDSCRNRKFCGERITNHEHYTDTLKRFAIIMDRRKKIILIVVIIIAAILLLVLFLAGRRKPQEGREPSSEEGAQTSGEAASLLPLARPLTESELNILQERNELQSIAKIFIERYGSFSNQGNFENLRDVIGISTDSLKNELESLYEAQRGNFGGEYYGTNTRVLSLKTYKFDPTSFAEARAQTQREEARGNPNNRRIYYQEIILRLVKTGDSWLVDSAEWQ